MKAVICLIILGCFACGESGYCCVSATPSQEPDQFVAPDAGADAGDAGK